VEKSHVQLFFAADFPDKDGSNIVYDSVIGCLFVTLRNLTKKLFLRLCPAFDGRVAEQAEFLVILGSGTTRIIPSRSWSSGTRLTSRVFLRSLPAVISKRRIATKIKTPPKLGVIFITLAGFGGRFIY